ncbi:30S ribosomal protein S2 [Spiroplasma endosymbiont of Asaphidion curtum]|uniref:30S ribosomal protein S2 n=1 Tax=Spiroplasma endosymbiont of Asaphidion curtum TaxID=3066281 RepID=UPI003CC7AB13
MASVTKEKLLEAGTHFGHQTKRWNPKMKKYIFTEKSGVYIIDLHKTMIKLEEALEFVKSITKTGGKIIFVGTKKQAQNIIKEQAVRSNSFYVNKRWLGGTLTNLRTIQKSVKKLWNIERREKTTELSVLPKKEQILIQKDKEKLDKFLSGIRHMRALPQAIFVIDTNVEHNAIKEALKLNIPIIAICDTNSDPDGISYPIPGNDDAAKTIALISSLVADAIIEATDLTIVKEEKLQTNASAESVPAVISPSKKEAEIVKKNDGAKGTKE